MDKQSKPIMLLHAMVKGADTERQFFAASEDVEVVSLAQGPDYMTSRADQATAGFDSVRLAREAERAGYKAIVISCHGDPNLFSLREAVRIPVLGVMQSAMHFCSLLAHSFSIIVPEEIYTMRSKQDLITRYGFERKVASVRRIPYTQPLETIATLSRSSPIPEEIVEPALRQCLEAIEKDDAGAITFGCGTLLFMAEELKKRIKERGIDIPVINPAPLTVHLARLMISQGLSHSNLSFPMMP